MSENRLEIKDLRVAVGDREIIKGLSLKIRSGEIHALMGPNGSGKSTLSFALMGHPRYQILGGEVLLDGENLLDKSPDERARAGLFLGFQYPLEIKGVRLSHFLWMAYNAVKTTDGKPSMNPAQFRKLLLEKLAILEMDDSFVDRYVNDGFSGGERKRAEILQMSVLQPAFAILDETDSGLDIDALRVVARGVNEAHKSSSMGILVITHYQRILQYIRPHFVHILVDGRIVRSGDYDLSAELERSGYSALLQELGLHSGQAVSR
ncbi:MAG: Fe-S cluster assembly ATPase SufC [bacterium JZ-2024 1]